MSTNLPPVVGVFNDPAMADRAIGALSNYGFSGDSISYSGTAYDSGFLDSLKSLFLGGSDKTTQVLYDLVNMGVPEDQARYYASEYQAGHPLVAVHAAGHEQEAQQVLRSTGGYDYSSSYARGTGTAAAASASSGASQQYRDRTRDTDVDVGGNVTARDRISAEHQTEGEQQPYRSYQERSTYAGQPSPQSGSATSQPSQPAPQTGYSAGSPFGPSVSQPQPDTKDQSAQPPSYTSRVQPAQPSKPAESQPSKPAEGQSVQPPRPIESQPSQPGPIESQLSQPSSVENKIPRTSYSSPTTDQPLPSDSTASRSQIGHPDSMTNQPAQPDAGVKPSTPSDANSAKDQSSGSFKKRSRQWYLDRSDVDVPPGTKQSASPDQDIHPSVDPDMNNLRPPREDPSQ